jgi:pimeloyl-ACP methyl ester carboxylesterase
LPIRGWVPGGLEREVLDEYLSKSFEHTSLAVALDIFKAGRRDGFKSLDGMIDYGTAFEMLDRPLLVIAGTEDRLAPPESVRPAYVASRSRDKTYRAWPLGHLDLVMGREATRTVWPLVRAWLARR